MPSCPTCSAYWSAHQTSRLLATTSLLALFTLLGSPMAEAHSMTSKLLVPPGSPVEAEEAEEAGGCASRNADAEAKQVFAHQSPTSERLDSEIPAEDPEEEEEAVDFAAEEAAMDQERRSAGGGHPGGPGGHLGFKLYLDLLVEHTLGEKNFSFFPRHTYLLLQLMPTDSIMLLMDVGTNPVFFELQWQVLPELAIRGGKLLVPFGSNQFHHLIGGRVDELSHFLPDLWADYGLGLTHVAYDAEKVSLEYELYLVNGFQGTDEPRISSGLPSDNNHFKGLGTRLTVGFLGGYRLIGSLYYDRWDPENKHALVFYSVAAEIGQGAINVPVLRRLGLRGEWARGEFQLPWGNVLRGLLHHAYARAGFYAELKAKILDAMAVRLRLGQINPNNTVTDETDVRLLEPALVLGSGKLTFVVAYQIIARVGYSHRAKDPGDVAYAKVFLQY